MCLINGIKKAIEDLLLAKGVSDFEIAQRNNESIIILNKWSVTDDYIQYRKEAYILKAKTLQDGTTEVYHVLRGYKEVHFKRLAE